MFNNAATDLVGFIAKHGFSTQALDATQKALQAAYDLGKDAQEVPTEATVLNPGITEETAETIENEGEPTADDIVPPAAQAAKGRRKTA